VETQNCGTCGGTILAPAQGGAPRGTCHCPENLTAEPEATKTPEKVRKARKPIGFEAKGEVRQLKSGSKLALLIDLLAGEEGTTVEEITQELSRTGSRVDARAWIGFDLRRAGYGVREEGDRLHLTFPKGMTEPLAHKDTTARQTQQATGEKVAASPRRAVKAAQRPKAAKRDRKAKRVAAR